MVDLERGENLIPLGYEIEPSYTCRFFIDGVTSDEFGKAAEESSKSGIPIE